MNHDFEPWDNVKVREAVSLAINRERIVENFIRPDRQLRRTSRPVRSRLDASATCGPTTDVERAKAMLAEAGFPDGIDTKLSFRANARGYVPQQTETATDFQAQLRGIDIHAELDEQESSTYITNANRATWRACSCSAGAPTIRMSPTSSTTTSARDARMRSATCYPEIYDPLNEGGSTSRSRRLAKPHIPRPTTRSVSSVPWSRLASRRICERVLGWRREPSALALRQRAPLRNGPPGWQRPDRDHAEPGSREASSAPTRRTARHSGPASRSWKVCTAITCRASMRCPPWPRAASQRDPGHVDMPPARGGDVP